MSDQDYARQQAQQNHQTNPQTPMATPQAIPSSVVREAYNAQIAVERSKSDK